eukprot:SAG31_NODE_1186_length_9492_cov_70.124987_14_plen_133_part_00
MAARRRKEPIDVDHPEGWPALQKSLDELIYVSPIAFASGFHLDMAAQSRPNSAAVPWCPQTCENDLQAAGDIRTSMKNYTIVYGLCVQRPPMNFCAELYRCDAEPPRSKLVGFLPNWDDWDDWDDWDNWGAA